MSTVVEFPGLGIEITVNRVAFSIFGVEFYWYGVLIAVGALLAVWYAYRRMDEFGLDWDHTVDAILISTICSIIGSRLYYVIFAERGEFKTLIDILDIRKGGVAFYGSVIGAFIAAAFVCRYHRIKIRPFFDLGSIGFLIGQGVGRWGNFVNQEAFGNNTSLPWGMTSFDVFSYLFTNQNTLESHGMTVDPVMPVHPTFLYESLWCLLGLILFTLYIKRRKYDGEMFLMYIAWNGIGRGFIEGLRTDSLYIGSIRVSQLLAISCSILAIAAIIYFRYIVTKKRKEDPDYLIPYGRTEQYEIDKEDLAKVREIQREKYEEKRKLRKARRGFGADNLFDEDDEDEVNDKSSNELSEDSEVTELLDIAEEEKVGIEKHSFTIEEIE